MTKHEIARVRKKLGITQSAMSLLLGCSWVTVSKWERGLASPNDYQRSLLASFEAASLTRGVGEIASNELSSNGIAAGLYVLLDAARHNRKVSY